MESYLNIMKKVRKGNIHTIKSHLVSCMHLHHNGGWYRFSVSKIGYCSVCRIKAFFFSFFAKLRKHLVNGELQLEKG